MKNVLEKCATHPKPPQTENTDRKFCFYEKIVESLSAERVRKIIPFRRIIKMN